MFLLCSIWAFLEGLFMKEEFELDKEKFLDVVHFVIDYVLDTHGTYALGNTKLHKIVYYADMLHYLDHGIPMTGAEYQRQKFGPTARHLSWALSKLKNAQNISVTNSNFYGYNKVDYSCLSKPLSNKINSYDKDLIKHVSDFVCVQTASEISEFSHDTVWESVPMGERIPYYASFAMFQYEVSDDDRKVIDERIFEVIPTIKAELDESKAVGNR